MLVFAEPCLTFETKNNAISDLCPGGAPSKARTRSLEEELVRTQAKRSEASQAYNPLIAFCMI
jgi:hypothetical protein